MDKEVAAVNGKINVLEVSSSRNGSRLSDGRQSYFEKAHVQTTRRLNPDATAYNPEKMDYNTNGRDSIAPPLVVRPKERTEEETSKSEKANVKIQVTTVLSVSGSTPLLQTEQRS